MIENVSTQLTVFHCFAHCLLPGRAFASLYVLLFLEKEAEIGGRAIAYCKIDLLWMIGTHQLVYKDITRARHVFIAFSRFKTFLCFGHSKIKVRSCVLCVYAGTSLSKYTMWFKIYGHFH